MTSKKTIDSCKESLLATVSRLEKWRREASSEIGYDYNSKLVQRQNHTASLELLQDSKDALHRIEDGTFGVCVDCKQEIKEERLIVRPEASRCTPCQEKRGLRVR